MFSLFFYALVAAFTVQIDAHSAPPGPLDRLAQPSVRSLDIVPRHWARDTSPALRHSDSFRLIFEAFDTKYHLHLRPNEHLIHPSARVHYWSNGPASSTVETKPLLKESVKAYWGEVISAEYSDERLREDAAGVVPPSLSHPAVLGWARIIVHDQGNVGSDIAPIFEGAFSIKGDIHHVAIKEHYMRNKHLLDPVPSGADPLVIWRESDVNTKLPANPKTCGHDNLPYNNDPTQHPFLRPRPVLPSDVEMNNPWELSKRDDVAGGGSGTNFADSIGNTAGCPKEQQILFMGVAADCKYVQQYGSRENATRQILNDWNTASTLYKQTYNVSLGIIELQIQDSTCPTTPNASVPWNVDCSTVLNDRLSLFSEWRGDKGDDGAGLWHLMSGCPTGTEVGIAWLNVLCQQTASGGTGGSGTVSGTGVSTSGRTEWQVVAHEIGHNFGAIHDCADGCNSTTNCCPLSTSTCDANSQFIMSPVAQASEKIFSQCTVGNICSLMTGVDGTKTNTTCFADPSSTKVQTIGLQMCGNGIVEPGEDCDPGSGITSPCCNSQTCKFTSGSKCDPLSSPCCTSQCDFAPTSQVCRPSKDQNCDMTEFCTGNSSACPMDVMQPNGKSCGGNGLACASGQCTSVALQCQTVGGSMGLSKACPNGGDQSCQISCQDPNSPNSCVVLSTLLIDGSPCGFGGMCMSGKCQPGSLLDTAKAWYLQNLNIAIPVTVVAGLFVLIILFFILRCLFRCCCGSRSKGPPPVSHQRLGSNDNFRPRGSGYGGPPPTFSGPPVLPPVVQGRTHWVDETIYNGPPR